MVMGLNPYDKENYIAWILLWGQVGDPWELGNPGMITPGGLSFTSYCEGCDFQCNLKRKVILEGTYTYCDHPTCNCKLISNLNTSTSSFENIRTSVIIFEATSTITINNTQLESGDYYTIN